MPEAVLDVRLSAAPLKQALPHLPTKRPAAPKSPFFYADRPSRPRPKRRTVRPAKLPTHGELSSMIEAIFRGAEPAGFDDEHLYMVVALDGWTVERLAALGVDSEDDEEADPAEDGADAEEDASDREPSLGWPEDFTAVPDPDLDGVFGIDCEMNEAVTA